MNTKGYSRILSELFYWITFLTEVLPLRSVKTFVELLIGVILTPSGFVCATYLKVGMRNRWTSYFKWLEKGKWSWLRLDQRFTELVIKLHSEKIIHLVIDDTLTPRASKKAPACQFHHQHGNKPNLAKYVLGQCWVSLAMIVTRQDQQAIALPLLMRLLPSSGNTGKLARAKTLIRALREQIKAKNKVRVLMDSWYMRATLIDYLVKHKFVAIGQVRRDTRLYDEPVKKKKPGRGRQQQYGKVVNWNTIKYTSIESYTLPLYGKKQVVHCRARILKARFLKGRLVKAVWAQMEDNQQQKRPYCLILCTDPALNTEEILISYGKRWSIKSMFHQLKHHWGMKDMWQQTRQVLHRWIQITQVAYGLTQLLSTLESKVIENLVDHSPWRNAMTVTAGRVREGLAHELMHVRVADWWDSKMKIFSPLNAAIKSKTVKDPCYTG